MLFIHRKKRNKRLKKALIIVLGLYIMIGTSLYFLQEKFLFRPTVLSQDYTYKFSYDYEELFFKTSDDAVINALHFRVENSKGVILYFHGNAGDLSRWGKITEHFVEKDYDVLVMDYRTYGKSTGVLSEKALYNDAQFCYNYLKDNYDEKDITVYGRSLGTGIATYIASKNDSKQLILETPYYNIHDVASYRFPMFPVKYFAHYKLPNNEFIKNVICPISIIHGTDDRVVPFKSGKKLFAVSLKDKTTFIKVKGGNHNNLIEFSDYHKLLKKILP